MRLAAAGEAIDTSDAAVAARYKQDVRELLLAVISEAQASSQVTPEWSASLADAKSAISDWASWTVWVDTITFDIWRQEGERLIAVLTDLQKQLRPAEGGWWVAAGIAAIVLFG